MSLDIYNQNKKKGQGQGPVANGKKNQSDPSKYDQNNQGASGQGVKAPQKSPMQLAGTRYKNMGADYQENVSQEEYKQRKQSQRMAGDALQDGRVNKAIRENYKVDNLQDFDLRATGAGGTMGRKYQPGEDGEDSRYGKGEARLSKSDVKGLMRKGDFDAQDIRKYGRGLDSENGEVFGVKAQKFLNKKIKQQKTDGGNTEEETTTGTNPDTDGGEDNAGQTNPGDNADTPNSQAGAESPGNQDYDSVSEMTKAQGLTYDESQHDGFVNKYMGINAANQPERVPHYKKYLGNEVDVTKLDKRIGDRQQYHDAKGTLAGLNVYGDYNAYKPSDWTSPLGEDPIESFEGKEISENIYGQIEKAAG